MPKITKTKKIADQGMKFLRQTLEENGLSIENVQAAEKSYDLLMKVRWKHQSSLLAVKFSSFGLPRFILEFAGASQLKRKSVYPVFVAPYISPKGAQILKDHRIGYCDLAGNCYLSFRNVLISKTGAANSHPARKEARSLFSPIASRITRAFLNDPLHGWLLKDLSQELNKSPFL